MNNAHLLICLPSLDLGGNGCHILKTCCFQVRSLLACTGLNASWVKHLSTKPRKLLTASSSGWTLTNNCVQTMEKII